MSDRERIRVKAHDEFDDPGRAFVEADGRTIGVLKVDGEYHALRNECLHQGGPICSGEVRNELVGEHVETGSLLEEDFTGTKTIACPWHGYTYELETGDHIGDDRLSIETFDVAVDDGVVYVVL